MRAPRSSALTEERKSHEVKKKALLAVPGGVAIALLAAGPAFGQEFDPSKTTTDVYDLAVSTNLLWVVIGAVLVIFMQAGFALVETGFCRAKHAAHVVSTNFAIFGLGFVAFFLVGFPLAFGGYSTRRSAWTARSGAPSSVRATGSSCGRAVGRSPVEGSRPRCVAFFLYMVAFMDTTATIPTGAMAERWKWNAFVGWGLFCGAIYYPLFAGVDVGWRLAGQGLGHDEPRRRLRRLRRFRRGAHDGWRRWPGRCLVLGPRLGKFAKDGTPRALPGHHIPMAMLGTFILLFGWFGFNAASTLASTDVQFAVVATNTAIAAAFGATIAMAWIMFRTGKPDPGMMANGMLAGLVAITAPCAFVAPWARRSSAPSPPCWSSSRSSSSSGSSRSTIRWARSASTACAVPSACWPSASSPTAATGRAGTAPTPPASRDHQG